MAALFEMKQGDSRTLTIIANDKDDPQKAMDLTGCTIRFIMRDPNTFEPIISSSAVVIVGDPTAGTMAYTFLTGQTAAVDGDFLGEFEVTFPSDPSPVTVPTEGYINVRITPDLDSPTYPHAGGTSVYDLLEETRAHIEGSQRVVQNALSAALDRDPTQVVVNFQFDVGPINPGDRVSLGLETVYVVSYDRTLKAATVVRGADNSPITKHESGEPARINPRYTNYRILRALNSALGRMSSEGLWQAKTLLRTVDNITRTYDLAEDMIGDRLLSVTYLRAGGLHRWDEVRDFDVLASVSADQYPSGMAVQIDSPMQQNQPLRIVYRAFLGLLQSLADDVLGTTGLEPSALDIPPLGAAVLLLAGAPVQRSDTRGQGNTRRAEEVSTTDVLQSPALLKQAYTERMKAEIRRLNSEWAYKSMVRELA